MEGIDELKAGFLNAHVAAHGDAFTAMQAGFSIATRQPLGKTTFAPSIDFGVTQYLGMTQTVVTGTLEGAPAGAPPFALPSRFDRTTFHVAPTLSVSRPGRLSVNVGTDYRVSNRAQGLTTSITIEQKL